MSAAPRARGKAWDTAPFAPARWEVRRGRVARSPESRQRGICSAGARFSVAPGTIVDLLKNYRNEPGPDVSGVTLNAHFLGWVIGGVAARGVTRVTAVFTLGGDAGDGPGRA